MQAVIAAVPRECWRDTRPHRESSVSACQLGSVSVPNFTIYYYYYYCREKVTWAPSALLDEAYQGLKEKPRCPALCVRQPNSRQWPHLLEGTRCGRSGVSHPDPKIQQEHGSPIAGRRHGCGRSVGVGAQPPGAERCGWLSSIHSSLIRSANTHSAFLGAGVAERSGERNRRDPLLPRSSGSWELTWQRSGKTPE